MVTDYAGLGKQAINCVDAIGRITDARIALLTFSLPDTILFVMGVRAHSRGWI